MHTSFRLSSRFTIILCPILEAWRRGVLLYLVDRIVVYKQYLLKHGALPSGIGVRRGGDKHHYSSLDNRGQ